MTVLVILIHQSCVGPLPSLRPVCGNCEESDRFVRLERVKPEFTEDVPPPFSHPFELDPEEWSEILAAIYVQKIKPGFLISEGKGPEEPAFTTEEIHYLSTTLPKAFVQAQPDEIIVYALSHSAASPLSEISTGGLFFKNDRLHVILANHRLPVSMPSIRELIWDHPLYSEGALYVLVPKPHQTILKQESATIKSSPLRLTMAYKNLFLDQPDFSDEGQKRSSGVPSPERQQVSEPSLEDKLELLNRLRTRDLITEEEFQKKKKELLDRF